MNKPESFGIVPVPVLANENHERYSRLRAILIPPRAAAKSIGLSPKSGVATKLEQNKLIQARIAELVCEEEAVLREKRRQIEASLSAIAYGDGSDFPGRPPKLEWPHRLGAISQLRDMHGFKAASKSEFSGPNGGPIEVDQVSDADRARALLEILHAANKPDAA
jgi:hypothetical protein